MLRSSLTMHTAGEVNPFTGHHIIAMPFPGRGHINPTLNLCTLLASKGIPITIVLTEEWVGLVGSLPQTPNIRLRSIPNVIPSEHNRAANYSAFVEAVYTKMEAPFDHLLDLLELPPAAIIADIFLPWMMSVGSRRDIPVVSLWTQVPSVFSLLYPLAVAALIQKRPAKREEVINKNHPRMTSVQLSDGTVYKTSAYEGLLESLSSATKARAIIFTSFYDLQPHVIERLRANLPIPVYTIGPSIPYMSLKIPPYEPIPSNHAAYFHWLDSQPKASILYVSLGSFLSTSNEQMRELSMGLGASGVRYLWVARDGAISRLQESCGENGLIVQWCDQLRVLCHSSVGGFLTHCGWNSIMESIFAGVPMLTFPLFADQPHNSKLIVADWKVGLKLEPRVGAENVVGREEISQTAKRLMDLNGEEGKELRIRAKELQETCRRAIETGGSTDSNITAFARDFVKGQYI